MTNLSPSNAALIELRAWLESEREKSRSQLETESDPRKVAIQQGRVGLVNELLKLSDPTHRRYGE